MNNIINVNYVKFARGNIKAWESLRFKDPDTIYFIYENNASTTGSLYLGSKLICSGIEKKCILDDVASQEGILNNSLIVYDEENQEWVLKRIEEIFNIDIMKGARRCRDGEAGLVPMPTIEDKLLFLRGDGTWADPLSDIEEYLANLIKDGNITLEDPDLTQIKKDIEELRAMYNNHEETFNTLDSLIYDIQNNLQVINNQLTWQEF